jgi:hypothetical protein
MASISRLAATAGIPATGSVRRPTVLTEAGPVQVEVPRDRDSSFEPRIVKKGQRRLEGVDGIVLSLSAKGLTTGEVCAHLAEVYGASVSKDTICGITDRALEGMAQWRSRPLDPIYPVVFIDAIRVKIRDGQVANRPICLALGVSVEARATSSGSGPASTATALRVIGDPRPCGPRAVSRAGGARRFTPALGHLIRPRRPRPSSAAGRPAGI